MGPGRSLKGARREADLHVEVGDVFLVKVQEAFQDLPDATADLRRRERVKFGIT